MGITELGYIPDRDLDFLSAGETLTVTYDVTVADSFTSSTQTVTMTMTGAEDQLIVNPVTADVTDTVFADVGSIVASGLVTDWFNRNADVSAGATITAVNEFGRASCRERVQRWEGGTQ